MAVRIRSSISRLVFCRAGVTYGGKRRRWNRTEIKASDEHKRAAGGFILHLNRCPDRHTSTIEDLVNRNPCPPPAPQSRKACKPSTERQLAMQQNRQAANEQHTPRLLFTCTLTQIVRTFFGLGKGCGLVLPVLSILAFCCPTNPEVSTPYELGLSTSKVRSGMPG